MSNVTTNWILALTEKVTAPLQKVMRSVNATNTAVEKVAGTTQSKLSAAFDKASSKIESGMRKALDVVGRLTDKVRQLGDNFRRAGDSGEKIGKTPSLLKSIAGGTLLAGGLAMAGGAIVGGVGSSINSGLEAGRTKTGFEVMAGKQAGGQLFNDVTKFAQDSIFGNELYDNANVLKSFGTATEEVMPDLKMIGDISQGSTEKMKSLTLAFAQVGSAGKLGGQDLLQFINAGFNPLQVISEKTGKSMADLKKKMEEGAISADDVKKAFQSATGPGGQFYQMTQKIAETPFGKLEAAKGQLEGVGMAFGTALLPVVTKVIDVFTNVLDVLPSVIAAFQPLIDIIASIPIGDMVSGLMQFIGPIVQMLIPALGAIIQMASAIFQALMPVFEAIAPVIFTVVQVVTELVNIIAPLIGEIMGSLSPGLASLGEILSIILVPVLTVVGEILKVILKIVGWVIDKLAQLISGILGIQKKVVNAFAGIFGFGTDEAEKGGAAAGSAWADAFNMNANVKPFDATQTNKALGLDKLIGGPLFGQYVTPGAQKGSIAATNFNFSGSSNLGKRNGRSSKDNPLSISGSGQGKIITMTLNFKQNFNVSGDNDVRGIADKVAGLINDRLKDAAIAL